MERKRGVAEVITYTCYTDGTFSVETESGEQEQGLKSAEFVGYGFATGILLEVASRLDMEVEQSGVYVWSVLFRKDTVKHIVGDVADLFDCPFEDVLESWNQFMDYLQDKYVQQGNGQLTRIKSVKSIKHAVLDFATEVLNEAMDDGNNEQESADKKEDNKAWAEKHIAKPVPSNLEVPKIPEEFLKVLCNAYGRDISGTVFTGRQGVRKGRCCKGNGRELDYRWRYGEKC